MCESGCAPRGFSGSHGVPCCPCGLCSSAMGSCVLDRVCVGGPGSQPELGFSHRHCLPKTTPVKILGSGPRRDCDCGVRAWKVSWRSQISRERRPPPAGPTLETGRGGGTRGAVAAHPSAEGAGPCWAGPPTGLLLPGGPRASSSSTWGPGPARVQVLRPAHTLVPPQPTRHLHTPWARPPSAHFSPARRPQRLWKHCACFMERSCCVGGTGRGPSPRLPEVEVLRARKGAPLPRPGGGAG